ncbi:hypothetical protein PV356_33315, partial [Streptomyces sp. WI03-5b]|nr:hypothetical protein [Streptomyces sp. WI03-5b]
RGAVKLLDSVIGAHPENTAARLLRARAFFAAAQTAPAELEFALFLDREPAKHFAHFPPPHPRADVPGFVHHPHHNGVEQL